ncbi:glycosyltransferase involved in cell wall biosynthesis [Dyadobacter jejuensis]|uniref:Glycosyltransferase involved in cell wall biosynthesis n=1 Tax=Dyadobacter jejuensis TaxID=1082580 RepID=A0A316B2G3_9BACT|nr:glycosyltransferase family 2 protein [Dyadobacter jejuensis]PWJ56727.1 glycosyltransferase involved in cell wall biosynthesis [Dyadobacter jejuensis]
MVDLSVIILTHNESKHIERCIRSLQLITDKIFIVDSYSTDNTVEIARSLGVEVVQNKWISYAFQFNFGIQNTPFKSTTWSMRMDADEYITPALAAELQETLPHTTPDISGYYLKRRVYFMDKWIRRGGYYPIWLLRIWRQGDGVCEELWMDEHIKLSRGNTARLEHDIVDHNLNNLTWWTQKHNNYAIREVIDLLNIKYNFGNKESVTPNLWGSQEQRTRYLKIKYAEFPLFTRPFIYFVYRYFFKLGFLDGKKGLIWHFLQGFWYRFLVDAKIYEVYRSAGKNKKDIIEHFRTEYGKDLEKPNQSVAL